MGSVRSLVRCVCFFLLFLFLQSTHPISWAVSTDRLENASFRFAVIGDYGAYLESDDEAIAEALVAKLVDSWKPEFIITLGDNNYYKGQAHTIDENVGRFYHDYIYPYPALEFLERYYGKFLDGDYENKSGIKKNRFFPSLGNHDWGGRTIWPYLTYFTLPGNERYYHFREGNVAFFSINSVRKEPDGIKQDSVQALWLRDQLKASKARFKVVYFHHVPYTTKIQHGDVKALQWPFQEWGADIVLSGHSHHYERLLIDDLIYVVNGLGGKKIHPLKEGKARREGSEFFYAEKIGRVALPLMRQDFPRRT